MIEFINERMNEIPNWKEAEHLAIYKAQPRSEEWRVEGWDLQITNAALQPLAHTASLL